MCYEPPLFGQGHMFFVIWWSVDQNLSLWPWMHIMVGEGLWVLFMLRSSHLCVENIYLKCIIINFMHIRNDPPTMGKVGTLTLKSSRTPTVGYAASGLRQFNGEQDICIESYVLIVSSGNELNVSQYIVILKGWANIPFCTSSTVSNVPMKFPFSVSNISPSSTATFFTRLSCEQSK